MVGAKRTHSSALDSSCHDLRDVIATMDDQLRGDLEYAKVNGQGYASMALTRVEDYRVILAELLAPRPNAFSSVLDESHDFQRFEHRSRGLDGRSWRQLKIVCRCGWATDWIDLDPVSDVARSAARDLLGAHVTEAIDRAHPSKEPSR